MIPHKLEISGAIGIRSGLGVDTLNLDLDSLIPQEAVTVAIKGDNGSGKSTLLNLGLTPWLSPPQIEGAIYDHFGPTGSRDLEWSHNGKRYRSAIQYRKTDKTRTTKAILLQQEIQGKWVPVRFQDGLVSDGKTSTYEECLSRILGSQDIYYLSAFRAQNAKRLADHKDPKELMKDLLHLDHIEEQANQAGAVAKGLRRLYDGMEWVRSGSESHNQRLQAIETEMADLQASLPDMEITRAAARDRSAIAKAEYERAVAADIDMEAVRDQKRIIERKIMESLGILRETEAFEYREREDAKRRYQTTILSAGREKERNNNSINEAAARIERHKAIVESESEARMDAKRQQELQAEYDQISLDAESMREKVEARRKLALELTSIHHTISTVAQQGKYIRSQCDELSRRAAYASMVPCRGEGEYALCPALTDSASAKTALPGLAADRERLLGEYHAMDAKRAEVASALNDMPDMEAELRLTQTQLGNLHQSIQKLFASASRLARIDAAKRSIEEDRAAIAQANKDLEDAISWEKTTGEQYQAELAAIGERYAAMLKAQKGDLEARNAELAALPSVDDSSVVDHARRLLSEADATLTSAVKRHESALIKIDSLRDEQESRLRSLRENDETLSLSSKLEHEVATWTLLSKGLKGVIDLTIEEAGPAIASIANKLLADSYGPRFTIQVVTQRDLQNGRRIECFEIYVIDAETGTKSSILYKSGGETVWLDKALTDAVGIYHQDASGMNFETLFADESEDGLTDDRKNKFWRMDRTAIQMGGYQRKYFVSHHPASWEMADAVIDMQNLSVEGRQ